MRKMYLIALTLVLTLGIDQDCDGATFKGSTFNKLLVSNELHIADSSRKTELEKTDVSTPRYPRIVQISTGLVCGFVFFMFCKFSFLLLELTSYEKFYEDHEYHKKEMLCEDYHLNMPIINPWRYLFNFKKWRLKQILDSFTYYDWVQWLHDYRFK